MIFSQLSQADAFAERSLRIGFFLHEKFAPEEQTGLKYWAEQVGIERSWIADVEFYDDINRIQQDFENGKVNCVASSTKMLLENFNRSLLADGFKVSKNGTSSDNLIVVVRKGHGIEKFSDLKNKTLGVELKHPLYELYLDTLSLRAWHKPYQQAPLRIVDNDEQRGHMIFDLFFQKVDAIITFERIYDLSAELNPQIKTDTQIIERYEKIYFSLCLCHKAIPEAFREEIIRNMLEIGATAKERYILQILQADKFVRASVQDLATTEALIQEHNKLLASYKKAGRK